MGTSICWPDLMTSETCCFPRDWVQDIMEVVKANHQTLVLFHVGTSNTLQVEDDCRAQWLRVKRWRPRNVLHPGQELMHPVCSHFSMYLVAWSYRTVWLQDPFQEVGIARDEWYQLNSMGQKCLYQQACWKEVSSYKVHWCHFCIWICRDVVGSSHNCTLLVSGWSQALRGAIGVWATG